jgi:hypothetical protein
MKKWPALIAFILTLSVQAQSECPANIDLLIVGDSQVGATWSKSYVGNFLTQCLKGNFVIYGRGGTVPGNWLGSGGMDHIETIQRDLTQEHLNLGSKDNVPVCKKRLEPMLKAHNPKRLVLSFGGNYITLADSLVTKQMNQLALVLQEQGITRENCFFITPTFEMQVSERRNVPTRNLENTRHITQVIKQSIDRSCQVISGLDLMQDSPLFDGDQLLLRQPVAGRGGCMGPAVNDNVHVCGMAAQDYAERICQLLNK